MTDKKKVKSLAELCAELSKKLVATGKWYLDKDGRLLLVNKKCRCAVN